jgi:hypothetical protein
VSWDVHFEAPEQLRLLELLEDGQVLFFSDLAFALIGDEPSLRAASVSDGRSKNISFDPATGSIGGCALTGTQLDLLRAMLARFSRDCTGFMQRMLPTYAAQLQPRLASYRPLEVEGRGTSNRKDDTRLHVDAFASRPNQGRRILRVFSNINDAGKPRTWLVGEPFEPYARRFLPHFLLPEILLPTTTVLRESPWK